MADGKSRERLAAEAGGADGLAPVVLCIGGLVIDRTYRALGPLRARTSNPVVGARGFGGVAGNVAANLARLGVAAELVSAVGDDESGRALLRHVADLGIGTEGVVRIPGRVTAEYIAVMDRTGELNLGLADMAIFDGLTPERLAPALSAARRPAWIFADCNLPAESLAWLLERPAGASRLAIDVVSTSKSGKLPRDLGGLDLLFLNRDEAAALLGGSADDLEPSEAVADLRRRGVGAVVITLGAEGAVVGTGADLVRIEAAAAEVVNVTGAGDALVGTALAFLTSGSSLAQAVGFGARAAALTILHPDGTRPDLSRAMLLGLDV